jgi:hypothetical protein
MDMRQDVTPGGMKELMIMPFGVAQYWTEIRRTFMYE